MVEERTFTMHQNLLRDVIERQAGSLDKAILEAVMNLIEANATRGDITITEDLVVIKDDGKGFETKDEIVAAFEVFGKSDERKLETKRWAEFQMGRGQLMAFGVTTYRTRTFEMKVDVRACQQNITYTLTEGLPDIPGCTVTVELYEPIDLSTLLWKVKQTITFLDIPITVNGKIVTSAPSTHEWDLETDDAYFALKGHCLEVFNLGVLVKRFHGREMPVNGIVVSKQSLKLNFARNDLLDSCPRWQRIKEDLLKLSKQQILKKRSPTPDEVRFIVTRWLTGYYDLKDIYAANLFRDTNGSRWSFEKLKEKSIRHYSLDDKGSVRADKAMQLGLAVVFDYAFCHDAFTCFDVNGEYLEYSIVMQRLFDALRTPGHLFNSISYIDHDDLYKGIESVQTLIQESTYTPVEKCALIAFNDVQHWYANAFDKQPTRKICLGISDIADGWTDAATFIAFDRRAFKKSILSVTGWAKLLLVMAHEYAHRDDAKTHDAEFYERYHRYSEISLRFLERLLRDFQTRLRAEGKKISKRQLTATQFSTVVNKQVTSIGE